jgi:hypothetical protein
MHHGWFRLCLSAGGSNSDGRGRGTPNVDNGLTVDVEIRVLGLGIYE